MWEDVQCNDTCLNLYSANMDVELSWLKQQQGADEVKLLRQRQDSDTSWDPASNQGQHSPISNVSCVANINNTGRQQQ